MGNTCTRNLRKFAAVLFVGIFSFLNPSGGWAVGQTPSALEVETQLLQLVVGKSQIIDTSVAIKRASMANPNVADTVVLSPTQLYVVAKTIGVTNLTLWDVKGRVFTIFDLEVIPDLDRLREQLHHLLPEEQDIRIAASHDYVTLSGRVTNSGILKEVLAVAEAYAPKKVINLLRVNVHKVEKVDKEDKEGSRTPPIIVDVIKGTSVNQVEF